MGIRINDKEIYKAIAKLYVGKSVTKIDKQQMPPNTIITDFSINWAYQRFQVDTNNGCYDMDFGMVIAESEGSDGN